MRKLGMLFSSIVLAARSRRRPRAPETTTLDVL
jgi:hypothetical protein